MQDRLISDWEPSERWPHYTRSIAGEVLPTPASPRGQQMCWDRGICLGWRDGNVAPLTEWPRKGSDAIIVSRELGLLCVVSVTDATKKIPEGATIEVDTDVVTVVEVPA